MTKFFMAAALALTASLAFAQDAMMKDLSGSFETVAAPTQGKVSLVEGKEGATLKISAFKTEVAPDLHVWLYTKLPSSLKGNPNLKVAGNYLDLGSLKAGLSSAEFKLPKGTDLGKYSSVVLWCNQVSTAFAVAKLGGDAMMADGTMKDGAMKDGAMKDGAMMSAADYHGSFTSVNAPTKGTLAVTHGKDGSTLNLSEFKTEPGPDLEVLLLRQIPPKSVKNIKAGRRFIKLGTLKTFGGDSSLAIPKSVNLKEYSYVVLWCNQVSAVFATAKLEAGEAMMDGAMKK